MRIHGTNALTFLAAGALSFSGCVVEHGTPWAEAEDALPREQAIIQGTQPFAPHHQATVSLNERWGSQVSSSIFCSGTLIAPDVVLTAAHCLDEGGNQVKSTSSFAIYVGDNPQADGSPEFHGIAEAMIHPNYNSNSMRNDLGLVRLATPVTSVDPVPVLPPSLGFNSSDNGSLQLEFVGFGRTENNTYDEKLVATATLAGTGCAVSGCGGGGTSSAERASKISYSQYSNGGPCNGDSGGPAFVNRGGDIYVGGMTSYGDASCTYYGVSARADTYYDLIMDFVGPQGGDGDGDGDGDVGDGDGDTGGSVVLNNGDTELAAGPKGSQRAFVFTLEEGATDLVVNLSGGSGDADLYVRFGAAPTKQAYDCRPYQSGNNENCAFDTPAAGEVHVMLDGWSDYAGATLTVNWTTPEPPPAGDAPPGGGGEEPDAGSSGEGDYVAEANDLSGATGSQQNFVATVPAGEGPVEVLLHGGTGDADLHVKVGSAATLTSYDCRPYVAGNLEQCFLDLHAGGEVNIMVHGYSAFSGASLRISRGAN